MEDSSPVVSSLFNAYAESAQNGECVIISGESGIGKSYYSQRFLNIVAPDIYVISISGLLLEQGAYNTINSAVYKHISERAINTEITLSLLQKLAAGIPRFGQYIAPVFDNNKKYDALINLVRKSGINPNEPNVYNIISFFETLSKNKKIVFYCDNIQWFDKDSLQLLFSMITSIGNHPWLFILIYSSNAELTQLSHHEISSAINQLVTNPHVTSIQVKRLEEQQIEMFCEAVMGLPVRLSKDQVRLIFEYSKGVPYYVKTILQILNDNNYIVIEKGAWNSEGNWGSQQLRDILKDCIRERIASIYRKIPGSRDALEVASVLGEEFEESTINHLFEKKDSFEMLSLIEAKFRLIQYLVDDHTWMFEHSLVQNFIYHSLGNKAKELHFKIATYLERASSPNYIKIATHFQQAGDQEKAIEYQIKEIELLLNTGCYNAAADLAEKINADWIGLFVLTDEKKLEFEILKARVKFHTVQYQAALELFTQILDSKKITIETKALCHRLLGRTYLKLSSQSDFQMGVSQLEIARDLYERLEKSDELGMVYADLVVANAHINKISDAESAFRKAEHFFNQTRNVTGMLRLQRRSPIFMESKLSAPILERTASAFGKLGLLHEQIMSLNNAATQFLYSGNLVKAKELLSEALSISINLDGFGLVYLYNNFGVISLVEGNATDASGYFESGRKGKFRHVEQLIIDINESVILALRLSFQAVEPIFRKIYTNANEVGENDYIVPAGLNLARCLCRSGKLEEAKQLFIALKERVYVLNSDYEQYLWNTGFCECLTLLNEHMMVKEIQSLLHSATIGNSENSSIYKSDYSLITMQFWSDN